MFSQKCFALADTRFMANSSLPTVLGAFHEHSLHSCLDWFQQTQESTMSRESSSLFPNPEMTQLHRHHRPCTPRKSDPFARKCSYVPFDDDDDSDDDDLVHSVNIAATSRTLSRSSTVRTLDFDIDTRPDNSIQPDSVIDRLGCTTTSISDRPFSDPTVESIMSRHRPSSPVLQDRSCELQPKYTQPLSCDFFGSAEFECDIAPTGS